MATKETDLYHPVKAFLEAQGYDVKAEIGAVDVMAVRNDEDPILVELKLTFSLALVYQGIKRQAITDLVYLAIPKPKKFKNQKDVAGLCRRLGLGLLLVRSRDGYVEAALDPAPFQPRKSKPRKARLLREFERRDGDPNTGGATRVGLVTSYRQDALKCAGFLMANGPNKGAAVANGTEVPKATAIMSANYYGWFERVERGVYAVTETGREGVIEYNRKHPEKIHDKSMPT